MPPLTSVFQPPIRQSSLAYSPQPSGPSSYIFCKLIIIINFIQSLFNFFISMDYRLFILFLICIIIIILNFYGCFLLFITSYLYLCLYFYYEAKTCLYFSSPIVLTFLGHSYFYVGGLIPKLEDPISNEKVGCLSYIKYFPIYIHFLYY